MQRFSKPPFVYFPPPSITNLLFITGHDAAGVGASWFLDGVEINVPANGFHYTFNTHRYCMSSQLQK